jgi:hypothetical protein
MFDSCSLTVAFQRFAAICGLVLFAILLPSGVLASDARYFSLTSTSPLPASPSSLLVQSPSFINVPAGSTLSVILMRGTTPVSRSELLFNQAYTNERLIPSVSLAAFYPTGVSVTPGSPLPGTTLTPGNADLAVLAAAPGEHRLFWDLSGGIMGDPGRAVATGLSVSFIDLKLTAIAAGLRPGDQKPGSVLFYNRYTSNSLNPVREDSSISLTNTNPTERAYVRIFLISQVCAVADYGLCLNAGQTLSISASDFDPDNRGYVMAVACNASGIPIQFNWLTGGVIVKQPNPLNGSPYDVSLSAVAVAKRASGALATSGNLAELMFDDVVYDRLPSQISADDVPTQNGTSNRTTISGYRPLDDLSPSRTASFDTTIRLNGKNNAGQTATSDTPYRDVCYMESRLWTIDTNPTKVRDLIPPGSTAWFTSQTISDQAILGAQFNYGRFSTGSSSRALSYAADYRIKMPVKSITCVN